MSAITRESTKFAVRYLIKVNTIVEVGVGNGTNALYMMQLLSAERLYLVDPYIAPDWWPNKEHTDTENVLNKELVSQKFKNNPNITLIFKESHLAVDDIPNDLDLVYIDAIHDYFNIKRDIVSWFPKIRIGGILCGHDYYADGVKRAVNEIFPNIHSENLDEGGCHTRWDPMRHFNAEGSDWWLVKKSEDLNNAVSWMQEAPNEKVF